MIIVNNIKSEINSLIFDGVIKNGIIYVTRKLRYSEFLVDLISIFSFLGAIDLMVLKRKKGKKNPKINIKITMM